MNNDMSCPSLSRCVCGGVTISNSTESPEVSLLQSMSRSLARKKVREEGQSEGRNKYRE